MALLGPIGRIRRIKGRIKKNWLVITACLFALAVIVHGGVK